MKKLISLILLIVLAMGIMSCKQNNLSIGVETSVTEDTSFNVIMSVVPDTITSTSLTVLVDNNTDIEIDSGNENDFTIEVMENGKWHTINTEQMANTAEALIFEGERHLNIDWASRYGALPIGHYRIVKYFFPWTEDGSYGIKDGFYLTAEFDIK